MEYTAVRDEMRREDKRCRSGVSRWNLECDVIIASASILCVCEKEPYTPCIASGRRLILTLYVPESVMSQMGF